MVKSKDSIISYLNNPPPLKRSNKLERLAKSIVKKTYLIKQVWFNGRTFAFQAECVGSIPATCILFLEKLQF